ncbi:MAG: FG-GAP-like repeat-containing protein, partial [Pseudomonadota bacterium]
MPDTTAPHGALVQPVFAAPLANPYGLTTPAYWLNPDLGDIDGDGDLDMFIGNSNGDTQVLLNTGSASSPAFAAALTNPWGLTNWGVNTSPSFVDIDNDGDLDAFIGQQDGNTAFYLNTGNANSPAFAAPVTNPWGLTDVGLNDDYLIFDVGYNATPDFADIDGDGDLDAFIGERGGVTLVYLNTGSASNPEFQDPLTNPWGLTTSSGWSNPSLMDVDGDGDLDFFSGGISGDTLVYLNTGDASSPAFAAPLTNPWGLTQMPYNAAPGLADIDGDGDVDVFIGIPTSTLMLYINNTPPPVAPVITAMINGSYGAGSFITMEIVFSEPVFVTGGTPTLSLETGTVDRAASYAGGSGTTTLLFVYVVQAGDTSADLDFTSSAALALNGATIKDAAGNNASSLALALPGATGSLAANAALVIDTTAPTATLTAAAIPNTASATVRSTEAGTAYLVNTSVVVSDLASITGALDASWNSVAVLANTNAALSAAGLDDGSYRLYTTDAAGNLSVASSASVVVDSIAPTASLTSASLMNTASATVQSSELGNAYLVKSTVAVTDLGSITIAADSSWNSVAITTANSNTALAATGLADGSYRLYTTDAAGNLSAASTASVAIDSTAPHGALAGTPDVAPVTSTTSNGSYGAGSLITLRVAFTENVFVAGGIPTLTLETGAVDRTASYISGSGTSTLTFTYTVQAGDTSADLDFTSNSALALNGATIQDAAGNNAVLTLAAPGAAGSLAANAALVIDTTAPTATLTAASLMNTASATVQSTEAGTAYLVNTSVTVSDLASITGAADASWNSVAVAANTNAALSAAGLADGSYRLYTTDAAGNLSAASAASVIVDATVPTATLTAASLVSFLPVTVQSTEAGTAYLVKSTVAVTDLASITGAANSSWNSVAITTANSNTALATTGLADGSYKLYTADAAGNLSAASAATVDIDTNAPRGTLFPVFSAPLTNPYGLASGISAANPAFADIDGDGDLDAFIGNLNGNTLVSLNTGSASSPAFAAGQINPYGLTDVGNYASPALVDIDGDGDLDAFVGTGYGQTTFYRNTGSVSSPAFAAPQTTPFGLDSPAGSVSPRFGDIDGDGDLDAIVGNASGNTLVYLNTGSTSSPAFAAPLTNPYGLSDGGAYASPSLVDIDHDGDLDVFVGYNDGNTLFFKNTGNASSPAFAAPQINPDGLLRMGTFLSAATPTFVDIDGDGDFDAVIGSFSGGLKVFLNTEGYFAPVTTTTANGTYGVGSVITLQVAFSENVLVSGGTPTLLLETGGIDRQATYTGGTGTSVLTFTYTVQAGDVSADLDFAGSAALALNGATIRDAAGNNAILTLSAPGAAGSLGASAALVIDGIAPTAALAAATLPNSGSVSVQSTETGIAYLVTTSVTVTDVASITASADASWNSVAISTANSNTSLSAAGLADGSYRLYTTDAVGNLSAASTGGVTIDNSAPVATLTAASLPSSSSATVQSTQTGTAYLVSTSVVVTSLTSITGAADASWNSVAISAAGTDTALSAAGLADGSYRLYTTSSTGNPGNLSTPSATTVTIDSTLPLAGAVSSATPNGRYGVGSVITLHVAFTENVTVAGGTPTLALETGTTDHLATYSGGSGTNTLSFSYTVQAGDSSADLDILSNGALVLNGASIRDAAGNNAVLTLATPGAAGSLAANAALVLDSVAPTATLTTATLLNPEVNTATVQSTETGIAYLVNVSVNVTGLASITGSGDANWNSVAILSANTNTLLAADGLADGSYRLYVADAAGNLSAATTNLVTIESATPHGALFVSAFAAPVTNPFSLAMVDRLASPTFVDIDGDGDLDAFIGSYYGLVYYQNTGSASSPSFAPATLPSGPLGDGDYLYYSSPVFVDIDADGDLDVYVGLYDGHTVFIANSGNASSASFGSANYSGLGNVAGRAHPFFADIDGDGDQDAFVGDGNGNTQFFLNTGSASSPAFAAASANPFGLTQVNGNASPTLLDLDGDGDLDAFIGRQNGNTQFFLNTGSTTSPSFVSIGSNPYGFTDVGTSATPSFADIDGDGDLDIFIGNGVGNTVFFQNTGSFVAPVTASSASGTYGVGSVITLQVAFSEPVIVNGGVPTLALETGISDRFAVYSSGSGTNMLTFTYTVQAGDTSADLDVKSSTALALNGATIRDAAGHDTTLTLAALGTYGSLAGNAALVIDTTGPHGSLFIPNFPTTATNA